MSQGMMLRTREHRPYLHPLPGVRWAFERIVMTMSRDMRDRLGPVLSEVRGAMLRAGLSVPNDRDGINEDIYEALGAYHDTIDLRYICERMRSIDPGVDAYVEMTGGGCATIYAGPKGWQDNPAFEYPVLMAGPGTISNETASRLEFGWEPGGEDGSASSTYLEAYDANASEETLAVLFVAKVREWDASPRCEACGIKRTFTDHTSSWCDVCREISSYGPVLVADDHSGIVATYKTMREFFGDDVRPESYGLIVDALKKRGWTDPQPQGGGCHAAFARVDLANDVLFKLFDAFAKGVR